MKKIVMGYIKIFRKLQNWDYYGEPNMVAVWVHLLLNANWEDTVWRGEYLERGSFVTSIRSLSVEIGLSEKQIRLCLKKLEKGKQIIIEGANKWTKITICNYATYQDEQDSEGQTKVTQSGNQMSGERATDKEYKNTRNKEEKTSTIVDVKKPKTTRFCPPTAEEVRAYADSIGYTSLDAEGFIDYYTQSGWIMGNGRKVKDWKACVRTWRKRDEKSGIATSRPTATTGRDLRDLKDGKPHRADELSEEGLLALRMENFELWREVKRGASFKWANVSNIFSSIPKMEWVRI